MSWINGVKLHNLLLANKDSHNKSGETYNQAR